MPTITEIQDQYPSTGDLPPIMGAQDDPVLLMLKSARRRYSRNMTRNAYIGRGGAVCAVGALAAAAGVTKAIYDKYDADLHAKGAKGLAKALQAAAIEQSVVDDAKVAIQLLNRSARTLFNVPRDVGNWSGPLEWVNQVWQPESLHEPPRRNVGETFSEWRVRYDAWEAKLTEVIREAVLSIYDHAIAKRSDV